MLKQFWSDIIDLLDLHTVHDGNAGPVCTDAPCNILANTEGAPLPQCCDCFTLKPQISCKPAEEIFRLPFTVTAFADNTSVLRNDIFLGK